MSDVASEQVDFHRVYAEQAEDYDRLVRAEDADGRLLPALSSLVRLDGASVLEIGVGTGRVTELLVRAGARVVGSEPSPAMLAVARRRLSRLPQSRWELQQASVQELALPAKRCDLAIAGWVLGHFVDWFPARWREEIGNALDRMADALSAGGVLAVIETLGTGQTEPAPPTPGLADYHEWLERERGFQRIVLRTDYVFADPESAASVSGTFFGAAFADRVRRERWARIPECTGVWWLRLARSKMAARSPSRT